MEEHATAESHANRSQVVSLTGAARPLVVVVGALLVLQSSQGLDLAKLALLAVTVVALFGSVVAAWRARNSSLALAARPWLIASVIITVIVGLSLPVALVNGTSASAWLRDAASYLLVAAAPWLAFDLGSSVSPSVATLATVIAGSLATVSFTITWMQRHNLLDLPLDRLVLPSFALATGFFALIMARSIWGGRDRMAWAVAAAATVVLLLMSGTRTTLALTAIPIVLFLDALRMGGRGIARTALAPTVVPLLAVALFVMPGMLASVSGQTAGPDAAAGASAAPAGPGAAAAARPTPDSGGRFGTLTAVAAGSDPSTSLRLAQYKSAWHIFVSAPLVGHGPGVPIPWTNYDGTTVAESTADTPLTILAKFGLFGIVIWAALGWATILTLRRLHRLGPPGFVARSALLGFAAGVVALSPFGPQLEDKGTGLALILLLGLALSVMRSAGARASSQPAGG